jgi:nitronate monooxygenase
MAGVSTPALAAAVSNAGGLGSLGIGASSVVEARRMIAETRALTSRPFNVNVFCHEPARREPAREQAWLDHLAPLFVEVGAEVPASLDEIYRSFLADEDAFRMLLEEKPAFVSFHFGLPSRERLEAFRRAGIKTLAAATSPREAALADEAGVDAIVAQGIEAGGHRGVFDPDAADERWTTMVLVRLLVGQTKLPVIAAGGIMDGQGIEAALDLGAAGVQLGTAFILCPESAASPSYRENLKRASAGTTRLTSVISGRPARGLPNRLVEHGEAKGSPTPAAYPVAYDAAKRLHAAATKRGSHAFATQWAGQGAPLARELPAAELVARLVAEAS